MPSAKSQRLLHASDCCQLPCADGVLMQTMRGKVWCSRVIFKRIGKLLEKFHCPDNGFQILSTREIAYNSFSLAFPWRPWIPVFCKVLTHKMILSFQILDLPMIDCSIATLTIHDTQTTHGVCSIMKLHNAMKCHFFHLITHRVPV